MTVISWSRKQPKRQNTIRQNLRGFDIHTLHLSLPLALPCSSYCATGLLNPPHSQQQSGEPLSARMNLRSSNLPLLLLTSLLYFGEEPLGDERNYLCGSPVSPICNFSIYSQVLSAEHKHVRTSAFLVSSKDWLFEDLVFI